MAPCPVFVYQKSAFKCIYSSVITGFHSRRVQVQESQKQSSWTQTGDVLLLWSSEKHPEKKSHLQILSVSLCRGCVASWKGYLSCLEETGNLSQRNFTLELQSLSWVVRHQAACFTAEQLSAYLCKSAVLYLDIKGCQRLIPARPPPNFSVCVRGGRSCFHQHFSTVIVVAAVLVCWSVQSTWTFMS